MHPTTLEAITLGVAIFGAVTGAAAIGTQVGQFVLSGPRVRVSIHRALLGENHGAILAKPSRRAPRASFDFPTAAVAVKVRNVGRLPTTVQSWAVVVGGGASWRELDLPHNQPTPHRLEGKSQETWYALRDNVAATVHATTEVLHHRTTIVRGRVTLGDESVRLTRRRASLPVEFLDDPPD